MTSLDLFRALAPEFSAETDVRVGVYLTLAAARLTPAAWGAVYPEAVVQLAAHMMTAADTWQVISGTASGPVVSRSAGDLSETYAQWSAAIAGSDGWYGLSTHGRAFLELRGTRAAGRAMLVHVDGESGSYANRPWPWPL